MKPDIVVLLGLFVLAGSGCGREASERFGTDKFAQERKPVTQDGPPTFSAPPRRTGGGGSSSGGVDYQLATGGPAPSMAVRNQMLKIKEENSAANVDDDVKTAFSEGLASPLVSLPADGARAFSDWMTLLETGQTHISRLRLSRDARFDRVEQTEGNGRVKIRRYEISFNDSDFVGWIEVKRDGKHWLIVDAGSYGVFGGSAERGGLESDR